MKAWITNLIRTSLPASESNLPSLELSPNPLFYVVEASIFPLTHKGGNTQIFLVRLHFLDLKEILYVWFSFIRGGLAKEDCGLVFVDLLPWPRFIFSQYFNTSLQSSMMELQKSKLSSTKNKWVSLEHCLHKEKPLISAFPRQVFNESMKSFCT